MSAPDHPELVRVASVYIPITSGLMDALVHSFDASSRGLSVTSEGGSDALTTGRGGGADLVICHFGHTDNTAGHYDLAQFIDGGYGRWPEPVFSSQAVLVGAPGDPAHVDGLTDIVQAFRQIAASGAPFVVDDTDYIPYLGECILDAAGVQKGSWYLDLGTKAHAALADAQDRNGYTLWGGVPFWTEATGNQTTLRPYVWSDPWLQRMMVSVVVDPASVRGVNVEGATLFQSYLLSPAAQAIVRDFRVAGFPSAPLFWPAGSQNQPFSLPGYQPVQSAVNPGAAPGAGSGG